MTTPSNSIGRDLLLPAHASIGVEEQVEWVVEQLSDGINWPGGPRVRVVADAREHQVAMDRHTAASDRLYASQMTTRRYFTDGRMAIACLSTALALFIAAILLGGTGPTGDWVARLIGLSILPGLFALTGIAARGRVRHLVNHLPEKPEDTTLRVGEMAANAHREMAAAFDRAVEAEASPDVMGHLYEARAQADEYLPLIAALPHDQQDEAQPTKDLIRTAAEVLVTSALVVTAATEREALLGSPRMAPPSLREARAAVISEIEATREFASDNVDPDANLDLPHTFQP